MSTFSYSIKTALLLFPFVAFLFTLPYIFFQYHKYGSIHSYRTIIIYSFLLYLLSAYFLVILPLPDISTVSKMITPSYNFIPFHFISEILHTTSFHVSDFATYFPTLKEPVFYEAFFNILLTLPFGIYLHYYFQCDLKHTFFYSFCFSLFFELTQLSGLYFLYPRGYRVFDVDDLILNTTGGLIGYGLANLLLKFLPSRKQIDEESFLKGENISLLRRGLCFLSDVLIFSILLFGLSYLVKQVHLFSKTFFFFYFVFLGIFYFILLPVLLHQKTLAMRFFRLEFMAKKEIHWYHYFFYYFLFLLEYFLLPFMILLIGYLLYELHYFSKEVYDYYAFVIFATTIMIYMITFLKRLLKVPVFYEKVSGIHIVSSIQSKS